MKVVDMQEASLPVFAYYYETIEEFVVSGVNGDFFSDGNELCKLIKMYVGNPAALKKY